TPSDAKSVRDFGQDTVSFSTPCRQLFAKALSFGFFHLAVYLVDLASGQAVGLGISHSLFVDFFLFRARRHLLPWWRRRSFYRLFFFIRPLQLVIIAGDFIAPGSENGAITFFSHRHGRNRFGGVDRPQPPGFVIKPREIKVGIDLLG